MMPGQKLASSFRDPSGYVFTHEATLYRQINPSYLPHYAELKSSGLYDSLLASHLLVSHEEVVSPIKAEGVTIQPERIPFISYPYEWSFGQLKDSALATLEIQRIAMEHGMTLKDASAYNIQFKGAQPVLIDTLSFESYVEGKPWVAYRQFCQHFLAPLALMALTDIRLGALLRLHIDGVPLDLASKLLPTTTKLRPGLMMHIHAHARAQSDNGDKPARSITVSKTAILGLIDNLKATISSLQWNPTGTEWGDYYAETNYSDHAFKAKHDMVSEMIKRVQPNFCWDLGANTGEFSRLAVENGAYTVAWDIDPAAVEKGYRWAKSSRNVQLLPLIQDLTNPSPSQGWANTERDGFVARGPADLVLALALVHHLAIGNNVPLSDIAQFWAACGNTAIVEFVPKEDSQVRRMLSSRVDIFDQYHLEGFKAAITEQFDILDQREIPDTCRTLFLLKKRA